MRLLSLSWELTGASCNSKGSKSFLVHSSSFHTPFSVFLCTTWRSLSEKVGRGSIKASRHPPTLDLRRKLFRVFSESAERFFKEGSTLTLSGSHPSRAHSGAPAFLSLEPEELEASSGRASPVPLASLYSEVSLRFLGKASCTTVLGPEGKLRTTLRRTCLCSRSAQPSMTPEVPSMMSFRNFGFPG